MKYSKHKPLLKADLQRWNGKSSIWLYFMKAEYKLVWRYRWCNFFRSQKLLKPLCFIERFLYHRSCVRYGCDIPSSVQIGGGFQILHARGIVINSQAIIGDQCTIVTGSLIGRGNTGVPTIGNNVFFGGHSITIGGITIGNNVKIGAGAIVTCDVPDDAVMISEKARNIAQQKVEKYEI